MRIPLYYVGTSEEAQHHARPLAEAFDLRVEPADEVVRLARPGDVCVFFNEYFPRFRDACLDLKARGCPTLYAIDGILEWRNSWELPENGTCCLWVMRPVLSHKVACIGRSQARTLESWGNLGKCEVVGVPRFDGLAGRRPRTRAPGQPLRVLVLTAKCPGFTGAQVAVTKRSLADAKRWFDDHSTLGDTPIEPVWRITRGLEAELGVQNQLADTTGQDLAAVLETVDAVIATPSTAMLEAMLQGLPVALLDYHNRPHYVPAAWRITAPWQFRQTLADFVEPPASRMLYQQSILHDALECHSPATPRMVELIERMQAIGRQSLERGEPLAFPRRMLADPQDGHHLVEPGYDHSQLFPPRLLLTGSGRRHAPAEAAAMASRDAFAIARAADPPHSADPPRLSLGKEAPPVPTYTLERLLEEMDARCQLEVERATAPLRRELLQARQQLRQWQRRTLPARLSRLGGKVVRLLRGKAPIAQANDDSEQQRRAA